MGAVRGGGRDTAAAGWQLVGLWVARMRHASGWRMAGGQGACGLAHVGGGECPGKGRPCCGHPAKGEPLVFASTRSLCAPLVAPSHWMVMLCWAALRCALRCAVPLLRQLQLLPQGRAVVEHCTPAAHSPASAGRPALPRVAGGFRQGPAAWLHQRAVLPADCRWAGRAYTGLAGVGGLGWAGGHGSRELGDCAGRSQSNPCLSSPRCDYQHRTLAKLAVTAVCQTPPLSRRLPRCCRLVGAADLAAGGLCLLWGKACS